MKARLVAASLAWASIVHAMGPPAMVHTKDGSVYYGELVERVETKGDEHVTLLLATGIPKRIALKDVDPSPVSLPVPPREEYVPPMITVRTLNGSAYHGELIERVVGEHVILKLETGDVKTIDWADIDTGPPKPVRVAPREAAPIENVRTKNGSIYHGEIIEKVVRDHVTFRLATGEVKTIDWDDIEREHNTPSVSPRTRESVLVVEANDPNAVLERHSEERGIFVEVCHVPCREASPFGTYRVAGPGLTPTRAFRAERSASVFATVGPRGTKKAGVITSLTGAGLLFTSFIMLIADLATPSTYATNKTGIDWATGGTTALGFMTLFVGLGLLSEGRSTVNVTR